jgi:hypothetical protein
VKRLEAWLAHGRRRLYAAGAGGVILLLALGFALAPAGGISTGTVQQLLGSEYNTGSVHCVRGGGAGHDLCTLATERCRGTLVVKPVDAELVTIVTADPPRLRSHEQCANPETLVPEAG